MAAPNGSSSLDYFTAPLFDWPLGRVLPPSGGANADDLQDLLSLYLEQCKAAGGELFAFGMKFDSNRHVPIDAEFGNTDGLHGIHDIHMMQGNVGDHEADNGVFRDGGLVLAFPDRRAGIFLAFQTQRIPTDGTGDATADARPLSSVIGHVAAPTAVASAVYLERALINSVGPDPGREALVLGNCATVAQSLSGWRLVDRNGRSTALDLEHHADHDIAYCAAELTNAILRRVMTFPSVKVRNDWIRQCAQTGATDGVVDPLAATARRHAATTALQ